MSENKQMAIERLKEISGEIDGLVNESDRLIQEEGSEMAYSRAKSYWLAHIKGALEGRGSMVTMDDTIKEMEEEVESERQHSDDCDCVECSAGREKGGLDYDPSDDSDEFENHERQVLRDTGITEKEDK